MTKRRDPEKNAADFEDACEIIETCLDDLDLLTRAFRVINDACQEEAPRGNSHPQPAEPKMVLN